MTRGHDFLVLMTHSVVVPPLNEVIELGLDQGCKNPIKEWSVDIMSVKRNLCN
jgi:hypothetical protein